MKTLNEVINEMSYNNPNLDKELGLGRYTTNIITIITLYHRDNNICIEDLAKKIGISYKSIKNILSIDKINKLTLDEIEKVLRFFNARFDIVHNEGYSNISKNKWNCAKCENYKKNEEYSKKYNHYTCSCIKKNSHNKVVFDECEFYKEVNKK